MKVYLATSGEYSDYHVQHVFAREEDARSYELADDVEEYDLREGPVRTAIRYVLQWQPGLPDRDGDSLRLANPYESTERDDFDGHLSRVEHRILEPGGLLVVKGWDLNGVRKVYSEQRAQILARREGIA